MLVIYQALKYDETKNHDHWAKISKYNMKSRPYLAMEQKNNGIVSYIWVIWSISGGLVLTRLTVLIWLDTKSIMARFQINEYLCLYNVIIQLSEF